MIIPKTAHSLFNLRQIVGLTNSLFDSQGVADRVCLGLIPSSEGSWVTAIQALRWF